MIIPGDSMIQPHFELGFPPGFQPIPVLLWQVFRALHVPWNLNFDWFWLQVPWTSRGYLQALAPPICTSRVLLHYHILASLPFFIHPVCCVKLPLVSIFLDICHFKSRTRKLLKKMCQSCKGLMPHMFLLFPFVTSRTNTWNLFRWECNFCYKALQLCNLCCWRKQIGW